MEGLTKPPASVLVQNLSPSIYKWKDEPSHSQVSWLKFNSFYLQVEGRTNLLTSALVKIKVFLPSGGKTNQATGKCLGTKFKSFYLQVEGRTSSLMIALVKIEVFLPSGGKTNQATGKCLGTKFKSFYLRVEGLTKSLTGALVEF